ncbi:hypothetical protein MYX65_03295 [Acidobacteria bacterium AH-259-L09]|nr:hypothetical protein [Acidobacteria bacterium AH-259-L09]
MFNLDSAVGIEIHGNSLVFATVSKGLQDYALKNYDVLENYKELPPSDLHGWVQQYAESNGFNGENVILGFPRDQVVIRHVELPLEVEENLDQVVRIQVEKFEPLDEEQSYYDYLVLDRDQDRKKILLRIIMVRRAYLEEQLNLFRELNLYPAAIRVSSVGLYQVFSAHDDGYPKKNPYLIVAINSDGVEFIFLAGPKKFLSEKVLVSEDDLTFDRVLQELDRFFSHLDQVDEGLAKIYLTGALADHFVDDFRERFQDCELLSEKLNLKKLNSDRLGLIEAVGLAISGTSKSLPSRSNLIPPEKRLIAERPSFVPTIFLAVLLVIMGFVVATREYFQQSELLNQIESQIRALQPEVDQVMAVRDQVKERQTQLDELQDLMKGRQKVLLILQELTERIPENSFLQNLTVQGNRVSMTGISDSASGLLKVLLDSENLGTVESRYITPDRTMKNREKFSFQATVREE